MIIAAAAPGLAQDKSAREEPRKALATISVETISGLSLAFSVRTGSTSGRLAAQSDGDTFFVLTSYPHSLAALDATTGSVKWRYRPKSNGAAGGRGRSGAEFGTTIAGDRAYLNTLDGHTIALDAASGNVVWDVAPANIGKGETLSGSPLVAGDHLFIGNAGDDFGVRGWIAALDAANGRELWRRYSTGPDADVGIGSTFKPSDASLRGADRGVATWPPSAWLHGGGGISDPLFDSATQTVFHGTGYPAPWNSDQRQGDNLWTGGIFARDALSGDARWFTAINPHDLFALGSAPTGVIVDRPWHGQPRKLLIHADPNGYVYVLDRETGEILSANSFANSNAVERIDPATDRPIIRSERASRANVMTRDVCPGWPGALGGKPAIGEDDNLLFIPVSRLCMDYEARNTTYIEGTPYIGANVRLKSPPDGMRGALVAWDVEGGKAAWTILERFPVASGVLVTGQVVFYGTLDGSLKALDEKTGQLLWQARTSAGIVDTPILLQEVDGRQRIAVMSGLNGPFGIVAGPEIDVRDATAAHGMANALADLLKPEDAGGRANVFVLP